MRNWEQLRSELRGDLNWNDLYKGLYATDASNYQIFPLAVVAPFDKRDVQVVVDFAKKHKISILARGGGTSLVGQTVGKSIVVDFTKYMNRIISVDPEQKFAIVEPGVIRDEFNQALSSYKLHFAPDPATSSRAAIGGMIANNSSGTRSILYGKTIDHVLELEVLLEDGSIVQCKDCSGSEINEKLQLKNKEGDLYRGLFNIVALNREEIIHRFPKVMRRVGGYNLDEFLDENWNLSKIFVGSEGTLGIILSAKIRLVPNPSYQCICVVHFDSFYDSIAHIQEMVKFNPASVELLDELLIERSRQNIETKRYCNFIQGNPKAVQLVEFYGETPEEAKDKANNMSQHLRSMSIGVAHPIYTDKLDIESIFTLRKKGLGLLMGVKGNRKPIAFIEDAAVPLEHLADYIMEVFEVCKKNSTPVVAYAHASVGLLHVKPLLDLRDAEDIARMKKISEETLDLVLKYKGSWSGEHGDGLARGPFNEKFFGKQLYEAFIELKQIFDPSRLFNPGKIIDTPSQEKNLRYGVTYHDRPFESKFYYRDEGDFKSAVHLCNGVGECRKTSGGTMCPSYRATKDEKDSTRGRANILRLALSGQLDQKGMNSEALTEVMELCLSCKACKSECPSNVDMSKLKSEVLHIHKKNYGLNAIDLLIKYQILISEICSGQLAKVVNTMLKSKSFRKINELITGLDARRILPEYSSKFKVKNSTFSNFNSKSVVLFVDTYIRYHEPNIGHMAHLLLESLGFEVILIQKGCCQRPAISRGLLDLAKQKGKKVLDSLYPYLIKGVPVVICEPSCASSLKDDLVDLMDELYWKELSENIFLIEDFIEKEIRTGKSKSFIKIKPGNYLFHGHCHQKSIFGTKAIHQIFNKCPDVKLRELNTGCCGMAGIFGYEKKNYDLSKKLAEVVLVPEINNSNESQIVIADGFSCRHQIEHFTNKKPVHWLETIDLGITSNMS